MSEALVNFFLTITLITRLGIEGVAMGTAIPNICANLVLAFYTCRVVGVPLTTYALKSFAKPLLLAPVAPIAWLAAMHWLPATSWAAFVAVGALGTLVYGVFACVLEFGPAVLLPFGRRNRRFGGAKSR